MEVEKFIKTPQAGQIVKVYLDRSKYCFGIVKDLYFKKTARNRRVIKRQVVVLKKTKKQYSITNIDFYLNKDLVLFL